jgi:hypothetical protein
MAGLWNLLVSPRIAFASAPLSTSPSWSELQDVYAISIQRGRQSSLGQVEAGRCTVTLRNADRRYDPTNTSSPEYGDGTRLRPGRQLQVAALIGGVGGVPAPLFTGHVTGYTWSQVGSAPPGSIDISAVDAMGYLGTRTITGTFTSSDSMQRIQDILDYLGWPSDVVWRWLPGTGVTIPAPQTYAAANALSTIRTLADIAETSLYVTVGGGLWADALINRQSLALSYTFSGNYGQADLLYNRDEIYNSAQITPASGTVQSATGATVSDFFFVEYTKSLPYLYDSDALARAQYIVNRYQYPRRRISQLRTTRALLNDDQSLINYPTAPALPVLDIGRRVRVTVDPPGGAPSWVADHFVEGVSHTIRAEGNRWEVAYNLSPATYFTAWKLADSADGILGATTNLG